MPYFRKDKVILHVKTMLKMEGNFGSQGFFSVLCEPAIHVKKQKEALEIKKREKGDLKKVSFSIVKTAFIFRK